MNSRHYRPLHLTTLLVLIALAIGVTIPAGAGAVTQECTATGGPGGTGGSGGAATGGPGGSGGGGGTNSATGGTGGIGGGGGGGGTGGGGVGGGPGVPGGSGGSGGGGAGGSGGSASGNGGAGGSGGSGGSAVGGGGGTGGTGGSVSVDCQVNSIDANVRSEVTNEGDKTTKIIRPGGFSVDPAPGLSSAPAAGVAGTTSSSGPVPSGTSGTGSIADTGVALAATGFDMRPALGLSVLVLAAGAGLLFLGRRRFRGADR